ncbi:hypothetical protein [Oceanobacillus alkalisoli]|uniref:hypothetical protein n=1 Tax=Oceanobacillus alkalisoli TaxID=2925113 RepID=UPI001EEFB5DE|nr:hypothetical protein [Oceanobacillus alkalisoli]MCF3943655.1 hypothetical protein [Oceanobacillus alkalisoli]MCG5104948.1 hypothetical protein [Oceanobacillus alkalisoli]
MNKLLVAQLGMIAVVWLGMFFFYNDMTDTSRYIFYGVTSWLLFLIVMVVKSLLKVRKEKTE